MIGLGLSITQLAVRQLRGASFSPLSLFAAGEQGFWYDPSDFSTMFQDSAGSIPATAVGQPVGLILDKSGRGNHASQPTAINRPILRQDAGGKYYLEFNGVNMSLSTATIDFTGTDKMTVFAGVRKLSDAAFGNICELSASTDTNAGGFCVAAANAQGIYYQTGAIGNRTLGTATANVTAAPASYVITAAFDRAQSTVSEIRYKHNGNAFSSAGLQVQGAGAVGNFGNHPVFIGRRGGVNLPLNGHIYSLIGRGAQSTTQEIADAETWVNEKTGAY